MNSSAADHAGRHSWAVGDHRPLAIVVLLLAVSASGCFTVEHHAGCAAGDCLGPAPHVEVLRGISGYWPMSGRFQERLAERGISSTVSWCELYPRVADRLIELKRRNPGTPVVVVGYSLGANYALRLSRRLQDAGFAVDQLVLLETTYEDTVPCNVRSCFNVYESRPLDRIPFMRGIPIEADSRYTQMTNYDLALQDDGRYTGLNHLNVGFDDGVQLMLADAVAGAFALRSGDIGYASISDGTFEGPLADNRLAPTTVNESTLDEGVSN